MKKYIPKKLFSLLQKVKRILVIILYKLFVLKDIDSKKIVLYSPSKNHLTGNLLYIYNEIKNMKDMKVYCFYSKLNILKFIYQLATSKIVITDDYSPILYPIKFRKETKFIQIWHASGMFKRVGFARNSKNNELNQKSITHKNYTDVIISSKNLIDEYSETFKINKGKIKPLGTPRTDIFFNSDKLTQLKKDFLEKYPKCKNKKVILYAPTFRGNGKKSAFTDTNLINLDELINDLDEDYILLIKTHPFSNNNFKIESKKVIDISSLDDVNNILPSIDILITDYSSIIFDALLLNKKLIFYVKDLKEYQEKRGIYYDLEEYNYGIITTNMFELKQAIKKPIFNIERAKRIKEKHLNVCDGNSTKRFIETYLK